MSRGEVSGVTKNTPNRKCIRQEIYADGERVRYYHVTKGWKDRKIVQADFGKLVAALKRAMLWKEMDDYAKSRAKV